MAPPVTTTILAAALLLLTVSVPARAEPVMRFAVVVGNNEGLLSTEPLKYAERDAGRMAILLEEIGGVRPENLSVLKGRGPADLRNVMDLMAERISATDGDAVFVLYYSGHADSGWLRMGGRGIQLSEVRRRLELMPAKVRVAIVDACQSGEITRAKGGKVVSPFLEERPVAVKGLVILTSASAAEPAQESDILRSSFFSHYLMSGLRGPADASGDGRVSASEAYDYAYRYTVLETEGTTSGPQHPTFLYALEGEGDITLTAVLSGRARVDLASDISGTVLFVSGGDQIETEVVKHGGESVTVALVPGEYHVRWRARDGLWMAKIRLRHGDALSMNKEDFSELPLAQAAEKGAVIQPSGSAAQEAVRSSQPTPLTDIPLGGGASWRDDQATLPPAPPPPVASEPEAVEEDGPLADISSDPYKREYDGSGSFARHPDALLWPPVSAAIGLVGPGIPQIIDKRHGKGATILGLTVASLVGAGLLGWSASASGGDSEPVRGTKLVGATALGFTAFYTYAYGMIDAFYSVSRGGPGEPNLDDLDVDLALAIAPSLARTTDGLELTAGGGLGVGLAVHRNFVVGLRNIFGAYGHGTNTFQLGPEARLRGMFLQRFGWSVSLGAVVQVHRESHVEHFAEGTAVDKSQTRWSWAMYPYLAGMVHYFPARSWSLDFGIRGGVAIRTRRLRNSVAQPQTGVSVEYIGGLTWYY